MIHTGSLLLLMMTPHTRPQQAAALSNGSVAAHQHLDARVVQAGHIGLAEHIYVLVRQLPAVCARQQQLHNMDGTTCQDCAVQH